MSPSLSRFLSRSVLALGLAFGTAMGSSMALAATVPSVGVPAAGPASSALDAKLQNVRGFLGEGAAGEKKIDGELKTLLDYDEMAKVALGPDEITKHSKEEIAEFTGILRQLIEKNYKKRLKDTLNYQIIYKPEETLKNGDVMVKTEAKNLGDPKAAVVLIDYTVRKKDGAWIAVDIIPEGSSMAKTYHKEFSRIIKKDGWATLIKKMKDKLAKT